MSNPPPDAALRDQLSRGLLLLEQLHVLSQTEALVLDKSDPEELRSVVEAKEHLVSQIDIHEGQMKTMLAQAAPSLRQLSPDARMAVDLLKQRTLLLVEMIGKVDEKNRTHLETLKTEAVHSIRALQQEQELQQAYSVPGTTAASFSKLVE